MTRSATGLILLGALLLFAAACSSPPESDTASTGADTTGAIVQGSESSDKPLVTVSRSPT